MDSIKANEIHEPELDMNRQTPRYTGRVRRFLGSWIWVPERSYLIGSPRRSVDREQQQYSPLPE